MIIIAGWLQVDRVDRDRYVADCSTVVRQARTSPGCLDFTITADPIKPDRIHVYERWESDAHLERFRGAGPDAGRPPNSATPRCGSTASPPPKTRDHLLPTTRTGRRA
ncbi:MAG TPA: antibiotic biosynthesis monooxygenase family protein [Pseudonocardiaceae bacterium]|nr:antibiotic biosynthesis monooxygenase family protein [Pseudonocardiaceae bacterium]